MCAVWAIALIGASLGMTARAATTASEEGDRETVRPVNAAWMLEGGSSHLGDTYLSPLKYTGWNAAFQYERMQPMKFDPERWNMQWRMGLEGNVADNPAKNATMYYVNLNLSWGMMRKFRLPWGIGAGAGGFAGVNGGCVYNSRNGNNPASAKADVTVGVTGYLYRRVNIGRLPVMVKWQTQLPLVGAFFSPEYDELYYEIYLGNRKNLVHCAWPGNFFRWDNLITADLDLGNTHLIAGMRSRVYSTGVNNINTRIFSWAFVLGVGGDWMSVNPRKGPAGETQRIIYAY